MSSNNVLCTDCFYLKRDDKNVICTHPSSSQLSVKWNFSRKLYETTSESIRPMPEIPAHVQWVGMCDPQRGCCGWDECTYAHGKAERDQWNDIRRLNRKRALGAGAESSSKKERWATLVSSTSTSMAPGRHVNDAILNSHYKYIKDKKKCIYSIHGAAIEDIAKEVLHSGLVSVTLNDREQRLFHEHISFNEVGSKMECPTLSSSVSLAELLAPMSSDQFVERYRSSYVSIIATIFSMTKGERVNVSESSEATNDVPFLQTLFETLVDEFPPQSYNEVHLEYQTDKKLVGGSLDVLVGCDGNGKRPMMKLLSDGQEKAIYLGSLSEGKDVKKPLILRKNESSSFHAPSSDTKAILQPSHEIMAFSEKCTFADPGVPLLLIYGSRIQYQPLLYFPSMDVLLTTPTVVPLLRKTGEICTYGLVFLYLLFRLHLFPFNTVAVESLSKSGWKEALSKGKDNYEQSIVEVV